MPCLQHNISLFFFSLSSSRNVHNNCYTIPIHWLYLWAVFTEIKQIYFKMQYEWLSHSYNGKQTVQMCKQKQCKKNWNPLSCQIKFRNELPMIWIKLLPQNSIVCNKLMNSFFQREGVLQKSIFEKKIVNHWSLKNSGSRTILSTY